MIRLITQTRIANRYQISLCFFIFLHFMVLFFTGLFRHWGYLTSINDLGVWDQAVWGFLNGEPFLNTSHFGEKINWLAVHFHPILLIFTPLYLIYSSPLWFALAQALALSLTAWPIYVLAKTILGSEKAGLIWAGIYLVNPFLINAGACDFHPISIAVPFVALGLLAVMTKNFNLMLVSVFVILLCKEHLGIMVVGFGVLWWMKNRQWKQGILLCLVGLFHFYIVLKLIMPALSPTGQHVMLSEGMGHFSRYNWLGQSLGEIISSIIFDPFYVLEKMMFDLGGIVYLLLLMIPFLFFPIMGLPFLFPGVADLAANMLSSFSMTRNPIVYHSVSLVPILTVASIYGVKGISRWVKKFSANEFSLLILTSSFIVGYWLAPFPLPMSIEYWAPVSFINWPDTEIKKIHSLVGEKASISIQSNIGAHFSHRKEIYRFPMKIEQVDFVILRLDSPTKKLLPLEPGPLGSLADHLQIGIPDYLTVIEQLILNDNFRVGYWKKPWLVIYKDKVDTEVKKEVLITLNVLRKKWGLEEFDNKYK